MTDSITTQLVGAHFRPPAKALLSVLPAGHPLLLRPEPTNEYDGNAVQVVLRTASLDPLLADVAFAEEVESQLAGQGYDLAQVREADEWHLGYLPRAAKGNPALEAWNVEVQQAIHEVCPVPEDDHSNAAPTVAATLSFDSTGKPAVIIPWPPTASLPQAGGAQDDSIPGDFSSADDNTGTIDS